ncbi:hypothetical protein GGX14DRAFT_448608, partial [Mycena pura]
MSGPGYTSLLAHLQNRSTALPLGTIQPALAHHLAKLSPLPTPLTAIIVSSALFSTHPFSHPKLQVLFNAFRHATHLKFGDVKRVAENQSVVNATFARSTKTRVKLWANAVLKGIKGGQPILRLACCGGLLAGLEDLRTAERLEIARSKLEDEVVISIAESMDIYSTATSSAAGGWETEFQPAGDVDMISLALIQASQSLVLVAPEKIKALPLAHLLDLLTTTVTSTFASGSFFTAPSSTSSTLRNINESPLMEFIAPMSRLTALTVTIFSESRPAEGIRSVAVTLDALRHLSETVESGWIATSTSLTKVEQNDNLETHGDMAIVWKTLKTLLFANIMIADAALSSAIFIPPAAYTDATAPSTLALTVLHTLYNLSFVVSQFGGVVTTASPGFVELKKTFYLALDILAKSEDESNRFARELCVSVQGWQSDKNPDILAKTAYALTCIEQLIPVLHVDCIQSHALPLAIPHLSNPTHRETYESSHSVVLATFASHADRQAAGLDYNATNAPAQGPRFTERLVPFYAHCLIENSVDDRLSTPQLRLAFASLVRSASASARSPTFTEDIADDQYALAWYCVDVLLDAIHALSVVDDSGQSSSSDASDRLHRLHLTLISVVPSLPLKLLPRVLEEIRVILTMHGSAKSDSSGRAKELVDASFAEISERVGDREKEFVMHWWYDNRKSFFNGTDERVVLSEPKDGQLRSHL